MPEVKMTKAEWEALGKALATNFGGCTCRKTGGIVEHCAGHAFLRETDRVASRADMLLWTRRMRLMAMQAGEGLLDTAPTPTVDEAPALAEPPSSVPW